MPILPILMAIPKTGFDWILKLDCNGTNIIKDAFGDNV